MRVFFTLTLLSSFALSQVILPTSFSASFKQSVTNPKKKKINYSGTMRFSKKNGIKWIYSKPTKKDVCSDKIRLVVVDHDLEQVSYYKLNNAINLEKIVQKAQLVRKNVYTAKYDGQYYTLQVDSKGTILRVAYKDNLDNDGLIIFSKTKYSTKERSKKSLECKIPKAYDIVDG